MAGQPNEPDLNVRVAGALIRVGALITGLALLWIYWCTNWIGEISQNFFVGLAPLFCLAGIFFAEPIAGGREAAGLVAFLGYAGLLGQVIALIVLH